MSEEPNDISADDGPSELLLEAAIDDLSPEFFQLLVERLSEAGAIEVQQIPYLAANDRPGMLVRTLIPAVTRDEIEEIFLLNSSAVRVIALPADRVEARIELRPVTTRWGEVRLRLKIWRGQVIEAKPMHEDTIEVAREAGAPYGVIHDEAMRLGEVFIGQKM